jgi:DNA-binding NtrC family response regulator
MSSQKKEASGWQLLVVDDEPAVCGAIKMLLEFDGHAVETASNAKDALALIEQRRFDAVFTDYSMPEMKGDKLAIAIKERSPTLPVVMITAHADMLKASGNPLSGVDFLINKPFLLDDLRGAIVWVLPGTKKPDAHDSQSGHRCSGGHPC